MAHFAGLISLRPAPVPSRQQRWLDRYGRTPTPLEGSGRRGVQRSGIREEPAGRGTAAELSATLRHVRQHGAGNVRELAKTLGRDYKNVPQDVATLQSAGLLLREGRKLIAPWDELQDSIKAAGYTPELVDLVYITHMHADHVGGLMAGDKLAFPNAIVRSGKRDADFWLSKENLAKAREAMKGFFQGAQASVQRKKFYAQATKEHLLFAASHVSFPGIGRVRTDGAGYAWMPVNYMVTK